MTFPDGGDDAEIEIQTPAPVIEGDPADDEGDEILVGFADEGDDDEVEQTPLVKKLRDQIRKLSRTNRSSPDNDDDPEPKVSAEPGTIEAFDYDSDRQTAAWKKHAEEVRVHAEWTARQSGKVAAREAEQLQTVKRIQQAAQQLGVKDFDAREARVRDTLSNIQLKAVVQYAENPAAMIAALGGSQTKLDELAAIDDPAMFMKMLGRVERDLKIGKRKAPEPELRVRGGNASVAGVVDKELERLERAAEKSGNRSEVIRYKRAQKRAA